MDKRNFEDKSLAKIMLSYLNRINDAVRARPVPNIKIKPDNSPVTELDLALSELMEEIQKIHFPNFVFYSEEKYSKWAFPLFAIDPLDGTREYISGRSQWAISIGLFPDSNFEGQGWVYNPKSGECFSEANSLPYKNKDRYLGEVSRSEWESGFFTEHDNPKYQLSPVGSIAYKLGRLSQGKADFVISLRPKNVWDIAGGTLLCQRAGYKFYAEGKLVTKVEMSYNPPLIWCHERLFSELSEAVGKIGKDP